jgi:hypothetical protein
METAATRSLELEDGVSDESLLPGYAFIHSVRIPPVVNAALRAPKRENPSHCLPNIR